MMANTPDPDSYDARRDRIFGPKRPLYSQPDDDFVVQWRIVAGALFALILLGVAFARGCV